MNIGTIILLAIIGLAALFFIWVVAKPRRVRYAIYLIKQLPSVPFRYLA